MASKNNQFFTRLLCTRYARNLLYVTTSGDGWYFQIWQCYLFSFYYFRLEKVYLDKMVKEKFSNL